MDNEQDTSKGTGQEASPAAADDKQASSDQTLLEFDRNSLLYLCTVATMWAWNFLSFFSGVNVVHAADDFTNESIYRFVALVVLAVAFFCISFAWKLLKTKGSLALVVVLILVCAPWKSVLCLFPGVKMDVTLMSVAWGLFGVAFACLMFITAPLPGDKDMKALLFETGVSITGGALVYAGVSALPREAWLIALTALPYLSLAFMFANGGFATMLAHCAKATPLPAGKRLAQALKLRPIQLLYGLFMGIGTSIGISLSYDITGTFYIGLVAAVCIAGPVIICLATVMKSYMLENVQWVLGALFLAGLIPILLHVRGLTMACCCLIMACTSVYGLINTSQERELAVETPETAPFDFPNDKGILYAGMALGWGVFTAVTYTLGYLSVVFDGLIVAVAVFAQFMLCYLGRPRLEEQAEELSVELPAAVDTVHIQEEAFAEIASDAGLTKRQTEIFGYLAKGRNAPYIGEELVVSYHTVKAHIYRIYQKLDVHSQQELIDLVEERVSAKLEEAGGSARG